MAISLVAVGAKWTATIADAIIAAVNGTGDRAVVPTSVSGAGVTVGANGAVTLSGVTANAVINGCFTSTYKNYRIEFDLTYSVAGLPKMQLAAAGTAASTAVYDQQRSAVVQALHNADQDIAVTSWNISPGGTTAAVRFIITTKLFQPAVATQTYGYSHGFNAPNPMVASNTSALGLRGHTHRTATAYDGFVLLASGTVSGTIRIYGQNDN